MRPAGALVMRAFYSTARAAFTRADNAPAATSMTWSGTCYLKLVAEIAVAGDALIQASSQICLWPACLFDVYRGGLLSFFIFHI
jgi:hypothetical protein